MTAERLRVAAEKLRKVATEAASDDRPWYGPQDIGERADGELIAAMTPSVALALAETLEWVAAMSVDIKATGELTAMVDLPGMDASAPARLADAILGES